MERGFSLKESDVCNLVQISLGEVAMLTETEAGGVKQ
jgi:hypothetical protein